MTRIVAHPSFRRLLKWVGRLPRIPPNLLRELLVAAADADKLGLHDEILAEGDARNERRQRRRRDHLAAGGKGPPSVEDDDVALLTAGFYHIDGIRVPLDFS